MSASPPSPTQRGPPLDALKRFAKDLKDEKRGPYLELNLDRVSAFIDKIALEQEADKSAECRKLEQRLVDRNRKSHTFQYPAAREHHRDLSVLQRLPEASGALGVRSRFGEGDGSFFDRFVASDELIKQPMLASAQSSRGDIILSPTTGFRRHLTALRTGSDSPVVAARIQPYAERRRDRHAKEELEAQAALPFPSSQSPPSSPSFSTRHIDASAQSSLSLPPLSDSDRQKYFGDEGRASFFAFYNQLARQRKTALTPSSSTANLASLVDDDAKEEGNEEGEEGHVEEQRRQGRKEEERKEEEVEIEAPNNHVQNQTARAPTAREMLMRHLTLPPDGLPPGAHRPASARTRFISACLDADVGPRPGLLIRKTETAVLDLTSQRMGDDVAALLARALDGLPVLEVLNVCDNNLSDPGLTAIILALANCPRLVSANISKNKIDDQAADALSRYLSSRNCRLTSLIMQEADVDDVEASNFVQAVGIQNTVLLLDMSGNLLGSHERMNLVAATIKTGGDSLGVLLSTPGCSLRTLILAWNQIKKSGIPIAKALRVNSSLTRLDLSFNGIDNEAACCLGSALAVNTTMVDLSLAQNKVMSSGCFALVSGARRCHTLRTLDLSGNAIGELGAQCVLALQLALGREEVSVLMQGCSLKHRDNAAWFNPAKPLGAFTLDLSKDYDRAVCAELLNIVAEREDFDFSDFHIASAGGAGPTLAAEVEFARRRGPRVSRRGPEELAAVQAARGGAEEAEGAGKVGSKRRRKAKRERGAEEQGAGKEAEAGADVQGADVDANNGPQDEAGEARAKEQQEQTAEGQADGKVATDGAGADDVAGAAEAAGAVPPRSDEPHEQQGQEGEGAMKEGDHGWEKGELDVDGAGEIEGRQSEDKKEEEEEDEEEEEEDEEEEEEEEEEAPRELSDAERLHAISNSPDEALALFRQLDPQHRGALGRAQLAAFFSQLGLTGPEEAASTLLHRYDVDGADEVEHEELADYLQHLHLAAQRAPQAAVGQETRFLVVRSDAANPKAKPYALPDAGVVTCTVSVGHPDAESVQTVSAETLEGLLSGLASMSDAASMIEAALQTMRLRLPEGQQVLRALLKEGSNASHALALLLPRMASASDALGLLAAQAMRPDESFKLKHAVGWNLYRACIGCLSGFYSIALDNDADRDAFIRLADASHQAAAARQKRGLGDTSQAGDWSCFRNVSLNGAALTFDAAWLERIPTKGVLHFDFVHLRAAAAEELGAPLSWGRFCRLLRRLHVVSAGEAEREASRLHAQLSSQALEAALGTGQRAFECAPSPGAAMALARTAQRLYDASRSRMESLAPGWQHLFTAASEQEAALVEAGTRERERAEAKNDKHGHGHGHGHAHGHSHPSPHPQGHGHGHGQGHHTPAPHAAPAEAPALYLDSLHLGAALSAAQGTPADPRLASTRSLALLLDVLTGRALTCAQLAVAVTMLPAGDLALYAAAHAAATETAEETPSTISGAASAHVPTAPAAGPKQAGAGDENDEEGEEVPEPTPAELLAKELDEASRTANEAPLSFGSLRVELAVALYASLVDCANFEVVLHVLSPAQCACVIFRLGWLNVWSPVKPEGSYHLDMARREERQMVRMLVLLGQLEVEPRSLAALGSAPSGAAAASAVSQSCWEMPSYQPEGLDGPRPDKWALPPAWLSEATLPSRGVVSLRYAPARPQVPTRVVFCGLVAAKPPAGAGDGARSGFPKACVANSELIVEAAGLKLSFDPEKQKVKGGSKKKK